MTRSRREAPPGTIAWFHCFSGLAGDMLLGCLIDAGADVAEVEAMLKRVPVKGWTLECEPVLRAGVSATQVHVVVPATAVVRTYAHISGLIEEARLPERVRRRAQATFAAMAEVEGRLHRRPPEQVHFHEVGGVDAIVDIVGVCSALEVLEVDQVWSSAIATGTGMIRSAHGVLPNPAPAVMELLRGAPTYGLDVGVELTTPTGAALIATNATGYGPMPSMTVTATGYGAGSREVDGRPNVTQAVLGTALAAHDDVPAGRHPGHPVVLLEVNVDDATGEILSHAVAALLEAGALDAWVTPIIMKKGRPAHTVSALTDTALAEQVGSVLMAETGSLGVRGHSLERWPAARAPGEVDVEGLPVRVKVSAGRVKVEQDDAVRAARRTGLPLREVVSRAEEAWRQRESSDIPPDEAG